MNAQTVISTIQLILAPVVMVSACAILASGLLQRYAAINDRLRDMSRERFELLRSAAPGPWAAPSALDAFARERLAQIDHQLPELLHRHRQVHNAVLTLYCAIGVFVATMFVIALAAGGRSTFTATLVLALFLLGTGILLLAVLLTALEVRTSQRAVEWEAQRNLELGRAERNPPDRRSPTP